MNRPREPRFTLRLAKFGGRAALRRTRRSSDTVSQLAGVSCTSNCIAVDPYPTTVDSAALFEH